MPTPIQFTALAGRLKTITIAATAGNVVSNSSPGTGKRWLVLYGRITVVSDATAANRYPQTYLTDGTNQLVSLGRNSTAFTASETKVLSYRSGSGTGINVTVNHALVTLPVPCVLEGADQFRISILGGVAGDSFSGFLRVLEVDV